MASLSPTRASATGAGNGSSSTTAAAGTPSNVSHQARSLNIIRGCLSTIDDLYANIQGFRPSATPVLSVPAHTQLASAGSAATYAHHNK